MGEAEGDCPPPPWPLGPCVQDYTLVAVCAVASHLMKYPLGEDYGLRRLAERYGQDVQVGGVGRLAER